MFPKRCDKSGLREKQKLELIMARCMCVCAHECVHAEIYFKKMEKPFG